MDSENGGNRLDPISSTISTSSELETGISRRPATTLGEADHIEGNGNDSSTSEGVWSPSISDCYEVGLELDANIEGSMSQAQVDDKDSEQVVVAPPTQVMDDSGSSPYRIPDHVFSKKSNAPMEWSTASNESLFSIQMGNMSFTRDQFPWKSGELGLILPSEPPNMPSSTPLIDYSSNQPPSKQVAQIAQEKQTSLEKGTASPPPPKANSHSSCLSHTSDGSTKSFAFPILAAEGERSGSLRGDVGKQKPSSPRPQPPSPPQTPKDQTPNATQTPKSTLDVVKQKWVSCFSCCPFCN